MFLYYMYKNYRVRTFSLAHYEALCQKLSTTLVKVRWKFSDDAP